MSAVAKKIAIVGTCPSSRLLAPFGDPDVEIWACSPDNTDGRLPRIDRFFEIHGDIGLPDGPEWEPRYIGWLNALSSGLNSFRLICNPDHAGKLFPAGEALPKDDLVKKFGQMFFTSSVAWMMAMAISEGAQSIGLYGVDMSARSEYLQQRPGLQHFIYVACAMGIEISAPAESDILQPTPLYGFSLSTPFGRKTEVRRREVLARVNALDQTIAEATRERTGLAGALDDIDYFQTIWTGDHDAALIAPKRVSRTDPKVVNIKET